MQRVVFAAQEVLKKNSKNMDKWYKLSGVKATSKVSLLKYVPVKGSALKSEVEQ